MGERAGSEVSRLNEKLEIRNQELLSRGATIAAGHGEVPWAGPFGFEPGVNAPRCPVDN
jgi:hypothetical protein